MRASHVRRPSEAPFLGVGVGLRTAHYAHVLTPGRALGVDWFEAISENYMIPGGRPLRILGEVRALRPLVLHGVSLSIGSSDPLDLGYLDRLAATAQRFEACWLSDHLCWTGNGGHNSHDLLPLPYTEAALAHVVERTRRVQGRLGRRIALENPSSYFAYRCDQMPEHEFLARVADAADCGILLDVNNVFVSAHNHGFDARAYLDAMPPERVFQIHLAGHSVERGLLIDTHDHPVCDDVWALYAHALARLGPVSTLIEWDDHIPEFAELEAHAARARAMLERCAGTEEVDADDRAAAR